MSCIIALPLSCKQLLKTTYGMLCLYVSLMYSASAPNHATLWNDTSSDPTSIKHVHSCISQLLPSLIKRRVRLTFHECMYCTFPMEPKQMQSIVGWWAWASGCDIWRTIFHSQKLKHIIFMYWHRDIKWWWWYRHSARVDLTKWGFALLAPIIWDT